MDTELLHETPKAITAISIQWQEKVQGECIYYLFHRAQVGLLAAMLMTQVFISKCQNIINWNSYGQPIWTLPLLCFQCVCICNHFFSCSVWFLNNFHRVGFAVFINISLKFSYPPLWSFKISWRLLQLDDIFLGVSRSKLGFKWTFLLHSLATVIDFMWASWLEMNTHNTEVVRSAGT